MKCKNLIPIKYCRNCHLLLQHFLAAEKKPKHPILSPYGWRDGRLSADLLILSHAQKLFWKYWFCYTSLIKFYNIKDCSLRQCLYFIELHQHDLFRNSPTSATTDLTNVRTGCWSPDLFSLCSFPASLPQACSTAWDCCGQQVGHSTWSC